MKPNLATEISRLHLGVCLLLLGAACTASSAWAQGLSPTPTQAPTQVSTPAPTPAPTPAAVQDFSAAERLLFMNRHLADVRPPATLRYSLRKAGSLEEGFEDRVSVVLNAQRDGGCCAARGEFMTGARRLPLPDIEGADGNPVVMYFLEHDVREMQRLTKGNQNHFRKRIRMAVYNAATVSEVRLNYRGREVAGKMVSFAPYLDDPNRPRYQNLARKEYRFLLADAVPGGVFGIQTRVAAEAVAGAAGASETPLVTEELWLEGAQALAFKALP